MESWGDGGKGRLYEGCGKEGPVLCIFFSEFHHTYGPKISSQVPADFISKETFESVNVYLIPKPQLIRSIITVTLDDIKIVGYPVRIENRKYARNAFYYNLCFVCNSWARTNQYDKVVKDLSAFLRELEEDENLLSRLEEGENSARLKRLFTQVLSHLNTTRISYLREGKRSVVLRVGRQGPVEVQRSGTMPMLVHSPVNMSPAIDQTDPAAVVATNKIVEVIDGLTPTERIAGLVDLDLNKVKTCLQNLIRDGVVKLVSEFCETSMYVVTPGLYHLAHDKQLQADCLAQVSLPPPGGEANIRDIMRAYSSLDRGATVKDLCNRLNLSQMKVDDRKLIQFGLLHGLIRKLNQFVNYVGEDGSDESSLYRRALDGTVPYELACCRSAITRHEVDLLTQSNRCFISIYK